MRPLNVWVMHDTGECWLAHRAAMWARQVRHVLEEPKVAAMDTEGPAPNRIEVRGWRLMLAPYDTHAWTRIRTLCCDLNKFNEQWMEI